FCRFSPRLQPLFSKKPAKSALFSAGTPVARCPAEMNTLEMEAENSCALGSETVIHLPSGLLGFESVKRFLLTCAGDGPFHWLQAEKDPSLSFLVISPFEVT